MAQPISTPANKQLVLSDRYDNHFLSPYLMEFDTQDGVQVSDILEGNIQNVRGNDTANKIHYLPANNKTTWAVFTVFNRSSDDKWLLSFGDTSNGRFGFLENINVYSVGSNSSSAVESSFDPVRNMIELSLEPLQKTTVLIEWKSPKGLPTMLPIELVNAKNVSKLLFPQGIYILAAFFIGMAFFFIAVSVLNSRYDFLSFTLYYVFLTLILFIQNRYVVFDMPILGGYLLPLLYFMMAASGLMTARIFWDMEERPAIIKFLFYALMGISLCMLIVSVLGIVPTGIFSLVTLLAPSVFIFVLIPLISISISRSAGEDLTAYMFGWFIFLFGLGITLLPFTPFMQPISTAINAVWFSVILQSGFFMIAAKKYFAITNGTHVTSRVVEINEGASVSRLRESRENMEQERLLKVIEQERKVLEELRKSEARRTEEMRKAKEEADSANKAKSAFLAVVTHEIRTPMTGIMGMVRLLLDSNLPKDQRTYAQTIQDLGDAMLALLNDILDFEKIEQGKMSFETISFDLPRLLQGVAQLMNGHAIQKNIELKTKIGENLPRFVKGDPTRLRQVLLNLTGNAVKFTEKGTVTISAEAILTHGESATGTCEIYFGVSDSGIGISEEAQKNLFNPFSQANSSISRKFGGTGLGLAISLGLVQAMGSQININSQEGIGSTFFFTINLPVGQKSDGGSEPIQKDKKTQTLPVIEGKALSILVVDDNEINQSVVKGLLDKSPHNVDAVNSADIALDMLKKVSINDSSYDLILMDIELPGTKGDEATRQIRQMDNPTLSSMPIVALTGNLMPDQIEQFKNAGMDDVLEKPIDPDKLYSLINHYSTLENKVRASSNNIVDVQPVEITQKQKQDDVQEQPLKQNIDSSLILEEQKNKQSYEDTQPSIKVMMDNVEDDDSHNHSQDALAAEDESEPLNLEALESLKGHIKHDDLRSMLNDTNKLMSEIVDAITEAAKAKEWQAVSFKAHELRGMTGNFGIVEVSATAGIIEKEAKAGEIDIIAPMIGQLEEQKKRADKALQIWLRDNL